MKKHRNKLQTACLQKTISTCLGFPAVLSDYFVVGWRFVVVLHPVMLYCISYCVVCILWDMQVVWGHTNKLDLLLHTNQRAHLHLSSQYNMWIGHQSYEPRHNLEPLSTSSHKNQPSHYIHHLYNKKPYAVTQDPNTLRYFISVPVPSSKRFLHFGDCAAK